MAYKWGAMFDVKFAGWLQLMPGTVRVRVMSRVLELTLTDEKGSDEIEQKQI